MARKPCKGCPFARATEPGATGGTSFLVYIGQAHGPFLLPCHNDPKYDDDKRNPELLQCAGAASFRANVGVDRLLPVALLKGPVDPVLVFETAAELIAHHGEVPVSVAEQFLKEHPVLTLVKDEMQRSGVEVVAVERKDENL